MNPTLHAPEIATIVPGIEVGKWVWSLDNPLMRNNSNVSIAHDILAQNLNTMLC
jgi:hypothetical protein